MSAIFSMGASIDILPYTHGKHLLPKQWHKTRVFCEAIIISIAGFLTSVLSRWIHQSFSSPACSISILDLVFITCIVCHTGNREDAPSAEDSTATDKEVLAEKALPEDVYWKPWIRLTFSQRKLLWSALFYITFFYGKSNSPFFSSSPSVKGLSPPPTPPPFISLATFHQRQLTLAQTLYAHNISAYISEPSPNTVYYYNISSADWHLSERPFVFVLTPELTTEGSIQARVRVVVPSFEATRAKTQLNIAVQSNATEYLPWKENEDPYKSLLSLVPSKGEHRSTILVDENTRLLVASEIQTALGAGVDVRSSTREIRELRERKTEEELALLKYVNEMTLHAIRLLRPKLYLGITETKAQALLVKVYDSIGFKVKSSLLLFGSNAALPHGSSAHRVLRKEDFVLVDTGATYGGYVADITRTFALSNSKIPKKHLEIWNLVHQAQQAAYDRVSQGVKASDIDLAARQVIAMDGLADKFTHRLGHGIGLEGHEAPYLHAGNVNTTILPGNTFSNEPGVYIEGQVGVRLEDCWYMDEHGKAVSFTGPAKSPWEI